ncbi:MAG TPA: FtsQ-type POTRA domain-containing protein [Rhodanobacteraceae bacterium]|nr:FtsQ-type POTRA domain-containing protein [Rhodanobacteraceae bacterium]
MKGATGLRFAAWIIAITLVALPVVGVLQGWFASNRWPVRELEVHATFRHVSAAQIRTAVAPSLGAGFFAIDLAKVRDAVAALPWVSQVEVSKHWPDALDITVTEIQPIAQWGSSALLGRDGRIFKVPDTGVVNGLPQFNAPDDRVADVLAFYRTAVTDFAPYSLRVTGVDLSARGSWSVALSNGGQVVVGGDKPDQHLARFAAALPILMRGRSDAFVYADLRYSNGFAVRWPEPIAPATPSLPRKSRKGDPHAADGNV